MDEAEARRRVEGLLAYWRREEGGTLLVVEPPRAKPYGFVFSFVWRRREALLSPDEHGSIVVLAEDGAAYTLPGVRPAEEEIAAFERERRLLETGPKAPVPIAAFLYGEYREVKARCSKMVTALRRGAALDEIEGERLDAATTSGAIVLEGPSSLVRGPSFQCFALSRIVADACLRGRLPSSIWDTLFEWSLTTPGRLLGILGQDSATEVALRSSRWPDLLRAATSFWSELDGLGLRYTCGSSQRRALSSTPPESRRAPRRLPSDPGAARGHAPKAQATARDAREGAAA